MRLTNQQGAPEDNMFDPPVVPASLKTVSTETSDVLEHSLLVVQVSNKQYFVLKPEDLKALGGEHKVICYADAKTSSLNKLNGEHIRQLPKNGIRSFLDGMVTALNLVDQIANEEASEQADSPEESEKSEAAQIAESRDNLSNKQVQTAIRQALRLTSKTMDRNIDLWVMEASDRLTESAGLRGMTEVQRIQSSARQLEGTSAELGKRFQTRLVECLHKFNHPEKEQIDLSPTGEDLSLAEDDHWHKHTAMLALADSISGQTKLDFNQLNRRFSYLLNRRIKPEKNIIGPEMMAWCMCSALSDVSYNKEQVDMLNNVISELFAGAMGKIYREINLLWIGMDIIPQIKLRVWQDDYQPSTRY